MDDKIKAKISNFIEASFPPIVSHWIKNIFSKSVVRYGGNYATWEDALKHCRGFHSPEIAQKICAAMLSVKKGEAVYERDGVLFDKIQYSWPLLAGLLRAASINNNQLNVLDFGGSLGSTYYQNRLFLSHLSKLTWNIVEQPTFVEYGKKYFADNILSFDVDFDNVARNTQIDVVILSSSLPYIENPHALFKKILNYNFQHIIIDRTPFLTTGDQDRLTIEKVPPSIYKASYPAWFLNKENFLRHFEQKYRLIAEFKSFDKANIPSEYLGFIFERIDNANR